MGIHINDTALQLCIHLFLILRIPNQAKIWIILNIFQKTCSMIYNLTKKLIFLGAIERGSVIKSLEIHVIRGYD